MRYFRYENGDKTEDEILREQYRELAAKEKWLFRRRKWLNRFCSGLITVVSIGVFAVCIWLIGQIQEPEQPIWLILCVLLKIALGGCALVFSLLVCVLLSLAFEGKLDVEKRAMQKELLSKACAHLREYYELQEPCLVTKCYDSSDHKFIDHDVCLFVVRDELRITTNLKHGFFHGDKDLGCYVLDREEITVSEAVWGGHKATELKAGEVRFLLCFRGGRFVEKHFLGKAVQRADESDE